MCWAIASCVATVTFVSLVLAGVGATVGVIYLVALTVTLAAHEVSRRLHD